MSLHLDLLKQARLLATHEPRRPKQASLRRAVSAAYYALFHMLTHEAVGRLVTGQDREALRGELQRAFAHTTMRSACAEVLKVNGGRLNAALGGAALPTEIISIAQTFIDLQEQRHVADYDVRAMHRKSSVLASIVRAEQAFADWQTVRRDKSADVFMCALLVAKDGRFR